MVQPAERPYFSLIVATVGRTEALERLLASLSRQTLSSFEIILVDQNEDVRLQPLVEQYRESMPIRWIGNRRGLSRARNAGLRLAQGEVVAIPDDDCWYRPDCLEQVASLFREKPEIDGVTGKAADDDGTPVGVAQWDPEPGAIDRWNVWRRGCSTSIFLHRRAIERVGMFDEDLGAGSGTPFGAGEETDYLLRGLGAGCRVWYHPSLVIHHEQTVKAYDDAAAQKAFRYGMGIGRVLRRHGYPTSYCVKGWIRSFGGMVLSLLSARLDRARFYRSALAGKFLGWLRTSPE